MLRVRTWSSNLYFSLPLANCAQCSFTQPRKTAVEASMSRRVVTITWLGFGSALTAGPVLNVVRRSSFVKPTPLWGNAPECAKVLQLVMGVRIRIQESGSRSFLSPALCLACSLKSVKSVQRTLNGKFSSIGSKTLTAMEHDILGLTFLDLDLPVFLDAKKSMSKGADDKRRRYKNSWTPIL